jgi:hypothetical protein
MSQAQIFLDSEQLKAVVHSHGPVQVCDPDGNVLGTMTPAAAWLEQQDIIEAKRRLASGGPWYTTEQVFEHLRNLAGQ